MIDLIAPPLEPTPPPKPSLLDQIKARLGGAKPLPTLISAVIGMVAGLGMFKGCQSPPPKPAEQQFMTVWEDRTNWLVWTNLTLAQTSNRATMYVDAPFRETNKIHMRIQLYQTGNTNDPWAVETMEMRMPDNWFKESTPVAK